MEIFYEFKDLEAEREKSAMKFYYWGALIVGLIVLCFVCLSSCTIKPARASEINYSNEQIANAIYYAEGGANTRHPYGILTKYKTTTPRQACINTIKSAMRRYKKSDQRIDFISFLGKTYCPVGASNDPTGLNKNWIKNVKRILLTNRRVL